MEIEPYRMGIYLHPEMAKALNAEANRTGKSLGQLVTEGMASSLGLDPAALEIPKKKTGPKPGEAKGKKRKKP